MDRFGGGGDRFGGGPGGFGGGGRGGGRGGFSRQAATKALKESVQTGHKTGLPGNILRLFDARPPLPGASAIKKPRPKVPYSGVAAYVKEFASEGDPEYQPPRAPDRPPSPRLFRNKEFPTQARIDTETKVEKKLRLDKWKREEAEQQLKEKARSFDPNKDPKIEGDPYKTIVVARLSYDVTEKKLQRDLEEYGSIKRLRIVTDKNGKSRGYAFVEYESKKDMKEAYKAADGKKIEGRRILVDVERGRTMENWRPRRLGGGLGGQGREAKLPKKPKIGFPPPLPAAPAAPGFEDRRRDDTSYRDRERERSPVRRVGPRDSDVDDRRRPDPRSEPRDVGRPAYRPSYDPRDDRDRRGGSDYRKRDPSPRRDERDDKRVRRELEDGEVREDPRDGRGRGDRDRDRDRRRERDMI